MAALDLIRVGRLTGDKNLEEKSFRLMQAFSGQVSRQPSAFPQLLIALDFGLGPSMEIVIAGAADAPGTRELLKKVRARFLPNSVVALHPPGPEGESIEGLAPFLKGQEMVGGKPTAYVCQNYACTLPVNQPEKLKELLSQ